MRNAIILRTLFNHSIHRPLRDNYYESHQFLCDTASLLKPSNGRFAAHVAKDLLHYLLNDVQPIEGQIAERTKAAVAWLLYAQQISQDGGVSYGYFPCYSPKGWRPSYPETTGYIITSLLEFAGTFRDEQVRGQALQMASWEIGVQMPSGAVQGGTVCAPAEQTPSVFNTGMVLDGWSSAYRASGKVDYLEAAQKTAAFLMSGPAGGVASCAATDTAPESAIARSAISASMSRVIFRWCFTGFTPS